jgi:hypothetical protein
MYSIIKFIRVNQLTIRFEGVLFAALNRLDNPPFSRPAWENQLSCMRPWRRRQFLCV